jgi:hypothetical protein
MGVGGQLHVPAALPPAPERPDNHCIGCWVGPTDQSGQVREISPPPGFDPPTIQPIVSHYTDSAIPVHTKHKMNTIK